MNNVGGLSRIYICGIDNLSPDGKIIAKEKLIPVLFTEDTGRRKSVRKEDKNGVYYDLSIECTVAGSARCVELSETLLAEFALITTDYNDISRLDGNQDEPLRYEVESNTGEEFKDFSCVKLKFSRKLRFHSPVIIL